MASMREYFRQILASSFEPIDAAEYLASQRLFPIISKQNVTVLKQLYTFFDTYKDPVAPGGGAGSTAALPKRETPHEVYFDVASRYISASLSGLAGRSEPASSDSLASGANTPKNPLSPNPAGGSGSMSMAGMYEKGTNGITNYAEAYSRLLIAEVTNAQQLFDNDEKMSVFYFEEISNLSLSEFVTLANKINDHVTRNITTDSALSFELLDAITKVINLIQKFLSRVPARLTQALQNCQATTQIVFKDFIKYIETRVDNAQPNVIVENGISDATVDIMTRMKRLSVYKNTALVAIGSMTAGSWFGPTKPRWYSTYTSGSGGFSQDRINGNSIELLSAFFSDCIDALFVSLEMRAKGMQKKTTQVGFFLLTNLALIEHYVTSSDIYKVLGSSGADRLEKLRKRGVDMFLEGWKSAAALLMDVTFVKGGGNSGGGGGSSKSGLSSKDREAIKEKFRTFNMEFENLVKTHRGYNITNQALRQTLAKEVRFISPLYHRYYDKHSGGDFSKHVEKYIKYNKQEFDKILESLE